jgi:hypothetical protein
MPRRKGSLNINTSQMLRAIAQAPGETIILRLAHVMDNERFPLQLRLDALKWLSADQFGKLKLSQSVKEKLSTITSNNLAPQIDTKPPRRRRRRVYPKPTGEPWKC